MNDILGLGKVLPLEKLLDIIAKSVGTVTKPYFDRRDVDTKAYEIEKIAQAKANAMKTLSQAVRENSVEQSDVKYSDDGITIESSKLLSEQQIQSLPAATLEDRTRLRVEHQEIRKQINIETITSLAADELKNELPVTQAPVDETWASRFFNYASEVSDEEMRGIWGRILAGEIKQPGTYSLRTLEVLRNLSKREADIFIKASNLSIETGNAYMIFADKQDSFLKSFDLGVLELASLKEVGLIHQGDFLEYRLKGSTNFIIENYIILIERKAEALQKNIPVYIFTQTGAELLRLVKPIINVQYVNAFVEYLKDNSTTVKYAQVLSRKGKEIDPSETILDFPM